MVPILAQTTGPQQSAGKRRGRDADLVVVDRDAALPPPGVAFVATVSGTDLPLIDLDLPAGLRGTPRLTVARRQVCDRLGLEPDRIDILPLLPATGNRQIWTRVFLADAAALGHWRAALAGRAEDCRALLPDYLALPTAEGLWTIATDEDGKAVVRLSPDDGFAAEDDLAALMLTRHLAIARPLAVLRIGNRLDAVDGCLAAAGVQAVTDAAALSAAGLALPQRFGHGELAADLLSSTAEASVRMRRALRPWALPGALFAAAGLVWLGTVMVTDHRLRATIDSLRAAQIAEVRQGPLPSGPILDLRVQVARAIEARQAAAGSGQSTLGPVAMMRLGAAVLAQSDAEVAAVTFRGGSGLSIDVLVPDFATTESLATRLSEALTSAGVTVRIAGASAQNQDKVAATYLLTHPAPAGQAGRP